MKIDLTWGLLFVLPFVLVMLAGASACFAGVEVADPINMAGMALLFGVSLGAFGVMLMALFDVHWTIQIGGASKGDEQ